MNWRVFRGLQIYDLDGRRCASLFAEGHIIRLEPAASDYQIEAGWYDLDMNRVEGLTDDPTWSSVVEHGTEAGMTTVTIHRQGDSIGITLPAETCARLGLEAGQELTLIELADGIKLVKRISDAERQMELARTVLHEQADALRELAKR